MKAFVMGCGTSTGVPVIGCHCSVCSSSDPRNRRTRASLLLRWDSWSVLIDTSTDLRLQALRLGVHAIHAVLYTHSHADHVHGIDDLRAFNWRVEGAIPCYGDRETLAYLKRSFPYIFSHEGAPGFVPNLRLAEITGSFDLFGRSVVPVPIHHGPRRILGYRIGGLAYLTDCSGVPGPSCKLLEDLDVLILDALRYDPHPTHLCLDDAICMAEKVGPQRTIFTHMSHQVDYGTVNPRLPEGIELGYDGMVVECPP